MSTRFQTQALPTMTLKSSFTPAAFLLQRRCACGGSDGAAGACEECDKSKLSLQRLTRNSEPETRNSESVPPIVHEVLRSPGQSLDAGPRAFFESHFGHDFSQVRVHTDLRAADSARTMGAEAYTVGRDIVFGRNQYAPETNEGRKLIAHELTHTLQQGVQHHLPVTAELSISNPGDTAEVEAESAANSVVRGHAFTTPTSQAMHIARRVPIPEDLPPEERRQAEDYLNEQAVRRARGEAPPPAPVVFMCSKDLETSPLGRHAFFRLYSARPGADTYSLEPEDRGGSCYQGDPKRNFPADVNAQAAACETTAISLACLEAQHRAYPIGHYCTLGPNSNTYVGHIARACGHANPDPVGWTPGIDGSPPPAGTFAPSPNRTLFGCSTKQC